MPTGFSIHERSNSAPGESWSRSAFESSTLPPLGELASPFATTDIYRSPLNSEQDGHKSVKRASSLLLPEEMEGLPIQLGDQTTRETEEPKDLDKPPAVPPKSPRLTLRIPQNQVPGTNQDNAGCSSSTTLVHGSMNDFPAILTSSPAKSREPHPKPSKGSRPASPTSWFSTGVKTSPCHSRNRSAGILQANMRTSLTKVTDIGTSNKRDASQDSTMTRGRTTRRNIELQDTTRNHPTRVHAKCLFADLPKGVPAFEASSIFSHCELIKLQDQAKEQAKSFELLKYEDVKALSTVRFPPLTGFRLNIVILLRPNKELRALDRRCDYLRETQNSLRAGRRSLHLRMMSYIQSPRMSKFSREGIIRQEQALAELDQAIDEWIEKLDMVENRRTRVRQKLLEHMASSLLLQISNAQDNKDTENRTPPRSPVTADSPSDGNRKDVESIRIYADSALHALFANIEEEMDKMTSHEKPTSPTPGNTA